MYKIPCNIQIDDPEIKTKTGIIYNSEVSDKILAKVNGNDYSFFYWPKQNLKLNFGIYLDPFVSPLLAHESGAYSEQTCFKDIFAFSSSKYFDYENNQRWIIDQDLSYENFCNKLYYEIDNAIDDAFRKNLFVTLFYSGGIDSQVLLSFIIKKKLLDRTFIVIGHNIDILPEYQINNDITKRAKIDKILDWLKPRCAGIEEIEFTLDALIDTINTGTLFQLKSFSTYLMFKRYSNRALMFGLQGNNVLIHRSTYAGQIMLHNPDKVWPDFSKNKNLYTTGILKYNYKKDNVLYRDRFIVKKNYHKLNGINGNSLIVPIGSNKTFDLVKRIDWKTFDLNVVADALIPKKFLQMNTGDFMDQFISVENTSNWDSLDSFDIPVDKLTSNATYVPMDIEHDPDGLSYINYHIQRSKEINTIPLAVLVSIKSLQMISDRFKNVN